MLVILFIILSAGNLLYFMLKPPTQPDEESLADHVAYIDLETKNNGIPEMQGRTMG